MTEKRFGVTNISENKLINDFKGQLECYLNSTSYHKFIHNNIRHIHSHRKGVHDLNTVDGVDGVLEELRYLEWRSNAFFNLAVMIFFDNTENRLSDEEFFECLKLIDEMYDKKGIKND